MPVPPLLPIKEGPESSVFGKVDGFVSLLGENAQEWRISDRDR